MSLAARTHLTLLVLSASLAVSLVACSRENEAVTSAHSAATEQEPDFEPNNVLDDASMTDTSMNANQVQAFLDRTPYGKRSVLATYKPTKTTTAAQVIALAARRYEINPMLLLVRAQLENELVSRTTATETVLGRAFACGPATTSARGFERQASCAAAQLRTSLDRLTGKAKAARATTDGTSNGWATNERHMTRDGIEVIPDNDATAVLYAYKPWVGRLGNGDPNVGGISAHARLWRDFTASASSRTGAEAGVDAASPAPAPAPTPACGGECSLGSVCDESTGTCVECAASDLSNCQAEGPGAACIAGRCGCEIAADCGDGRTCDRLHGVCVGTTAPGPGEPPSPGPGEADAGKPTTTTAPPAQGSTEDTLPGEPTSSPTPDLPESSSEPSSSEGKRAADDKIEVPASENGGCTSARLGPASRGPRGAWSTSFGIALALGLLRRRRPSSSSPHRR